MSENYLIHSAKGWTKKNAKYISREWKKGKWVYEYRDRNWVDNAKAGWSKGKSPVDAIRGAYEHDKNFNLKYATDKSGKYDSNFRKMAWKSMQKPAKDLRSAKENTLKADFYNSKAGKLATNMVALANRKKIEKHAYALRQTAAKHENEKRIADREAKIANAINAKNTTKYTGKPDKKTATMSPQEIAKALTFRNKAKNSKTISPQDMAKATTILQKGKNLKTISPQEKAKMLTENKKLHDEKAQNGTLKRPLSRKKNVTEGSSKVEKNDYSINQQTKMDKINFIDDMIQYEFEDKYGEDDGHQAYVEWCNSLWEGMPDGLTSEEQSAYYYTALSNAGKKWGDYYDDLVINQGYLGADNEPHTYVNGPVGNTNKKKK